MADGVEFKLEGLEKAQAALTELASDMRRKVVMGALRDAGKPVAAAAKLFAPVLAQATSRRVPGTIRRSIGVFRSKRYKAANGQLGVYISVRASRAQRRRAPISGDPFYFFIVSMDHKTRSKGATKALRRKAAIARTVAGKPFLGPAFRQEGANALRIFEQRILARIDAANKVVP